MTDRREFLATLAAASAALLPCAANANPVESFPAARRGKPRWRTAFGLNGFMSSESTFGGVYPIWEVLDFAQKEGFEGIELVGGWPKGVYPDADDDARIASLRGLFARYEVRIFSIQSFGAGAFQKDAASRQAWLADFAKSVRLAKKLGCDCVGYWPGGDVGDQTMDQAVDSLVFSLKEAAKIVSDADLLLSVEIEPPFAFNTLDHLIRIIDGVDHPLVKGQYDPSHFDLFGGGTGKPEELLKKLGVHRLGYVHLTDTDGTPFQGTSKHLPCGDGHLDIRESLKVLWEGGYDGWIMIDAWMTQDPYDACRKGRIAVETAHREFSQEG